jgi:hypothetical protein
MATKVAIEVDVKTGDASDEIICVKGRTRKGQGCPKRNGQPVQGWF